VLWFGSVLGGFNVGVVMCEGSVVGMFIVVG